MAYVNNYISSINCVAVERSKQSVRSTVQVRYYIVKIMSIRLGRQGWGGSMWGVGEPACPWGGGLSLMQAKDGSVSVGFGNLRKDSVVRQELAGKHPVPLI